MKLLLCVLALLLLATPVLAQTQDLMISEYIEGSSYNKAIEIYNGTDEAIALGAYALQLFTNGSTDPILIPLGTSMIEPQEVFVIANPSASAAVLGVSDLTNTLLNFNGDDALVLIGSGVPVDRFGQVGTDPGTGWTCSSGSTYNTTLRRKLGVCTGDESTTTPFDPCNEYDFYPSDTFDGLGEHFNDCHSVGIEPMTWEGIKAQFR